MCQHHKPVKVAYRVANRPYTHPTEQRATFHSSSIMDCIGPIVADGDVISYGIEFRDGGGGAHRR